MAWPTFGLLKTLVGARNPGRLAIWSKDTPELPLILWLVAEAFLQLLASGLGTLALVWATVVLLGGYSTTLVRTDFWFTTAIVFVEVARIVGYNSTRETKFFVDVPAAFYKLKEVLQVNNASILSVFAIGLKGIALAPIFLATTCMSLSIIRLASNIGGKHSYGGSRSGNLKPALTLFYSLVLAQGALFLLWLVVAVNRMSSIESLNKKYSSWQLLLQQQQLQQLRPRRQQQQQPPQQQQLQPPQPELSRQHLQRLWQHLLPLQQRQPQLQPHLLPLQQRQPQEDGQQQDGPRKLIDRYVNSIADTCIQKGVASTTNSTLVSFAAELLLKSEDQDDHLSAVVVLHSLVVTNAERYRRAAEQICSSEKLVSRLLWMLRSNNPVTKVCIAEIVVELASNCELCLVDIPGGARCISSLLDPQFMKKEEETKNFVRGLEILGKLASDPENCREIYNTMDLVPKIIAPLSNGLYKVIKDKDAETTAEIVRESLRVVAKLTGGAGESSRKLCQELTKEYSRTAKNMLWILSNTDDQEMRMLAVEILSRLTLDESIMPEFTDKLRFLLFDTVDSPLGIEAGKTLVARGDEFADIKQLEVVTSDGGYSKEYRAVTAEMLAQIVSKSTASDTRRFKQLQSVAHALLSKVLQAIVTETTDITELDNSNRKFLAAFLGLAVHVCEKLQNASFADAVTRPPMENNIFAEKLTRIIEVTTIYSESKSKNEDEVCLAIMKAATKLVTRMMEISTMGPSYYIKYFRENIIVEKLDAAVKAMAHLERYMIMTEDEGYVTLQALVETAKKKLEEVGSTAEAAIAIAAAPVADAADDTTAVATSSQH